MLFKIFFALNLLILVISCSDNTNYKKSRIELKKIKSISFDNDSVFIYNPNITVIEKSELYFYDSKTYRIYKSDTLLNNIQYVLGRHGSGPDEFESVCKISFKNDTMYVFDNVQLAIKLFDKQLNFIKVIKFNSRFKTKNAIFTNNSVYYSSELNNEKLNYCKFSILNLESEYFGLPLSKSESIINRDFSKYDVQHLQQYMDKIYSVSASQPIIDILDINTLLLLKRIDLRKIPEIEYFSNEAKKKYSKLAENTYYDLFYDSFIDKNKLYLLFVDQFKGKIVPKRLIMFNLDTDGELNSPSFSDFPDLDIYGTIHIMNNLIYSFNISKSTLDLLKMEELK